MAWSALSKWISKYNNTGSFKAKDNCTDAENELLVLKKELKQLRMEMIFYTYTEKAIDTAVENEIIYVRFQIDIIVRLLVIVVVRISPKT